MKLLKWLSVVTVVLALISFFAAGIVVSFQTDNVEDWQQSGYSLDMNLLEGRIYHLAGPESVTVELDSPLMFTLTTGDNAHEATPFVRRFQITGELPTGNWHVEGSAAMKLSSHSVTLVTHSYSTSWQERVWRTFLFFFGITAAIGLFLWLMISAPSRRR